MHREPLDGDWVFVIHDFLSASECAALISKGEGIGLSEAPIADIGVMKEYRDNDRVMFDDAGYAAQLFERARPFLPQHVEDLALMGFNPRFRMYRYDPGQQFKPHWDGAFFDVENLQESQLTFIIYLNEGFAGGATNFLPDLGIGKTPRLSVQPRTGMALVFFHREIHEGTAVVQGRKYALRTDVMYQMAK
jgi:hypothetical protein